VATIQLEGVLEGVESLAGRFVTRVGQPTIRLQQNGRAQVRGNFPFTRCNKPRKGTIAMRLRQAVRVNGGIVSKIISVNKKETPQSVLGIKSSNVFFQFDIR
jgi:hypothetical protein